MKIEQLISLAQSGDQKAQFELALALIKGQKIRKDATRGLSMIEKLAQEIYKPAIELLSNIKQQNEQDQLRTDLLQEFNMKAVKRAPDLTTINGFGFKLYGKSNNDSRTESYETTHYLVFFFLPIIPTGRYRVIHSDNSYHFLGKLSLKKSDWLPLLVWTCMIVLVNIYSSISNS